MTDQLTSGDAATGSETITEGDVTEDNTDDQANAVAGAEGEGEGGEGAERDTSDDDESEEIELDGAKYRVPKALKDGYLRQADYTRKTQELAEHRRAIDSEREAIAKSKADYAKYQDDRADLRALDKALEQYGKVNWAQLNAETPDEANKHWWNYQQLKEQRDTAAKKVAEFEEAERSKAQQDTAKRFEEAQRELVRDIPGWGEELAGKLVKFARESGLSDADMQMVGQNPRLIKMAHKAMTLAEAGAKAKKEAEKAKPDAKPAPQPIKQVTKQRSGPAPSAGPSDNDSIEEWVRKRNAQVRKSNAA